MDFTTVTHIKGEINREYIRKMTSREWARLQGFTDEFKLPVADIHLYKQFRNLATVLNTCNCRIDQIVP